MECKLVSELQLVLLKDISDYVDVVKIYILLCLIKLNSKNLGLIGGEDEEVHLNKSDEEETLCETEDPPASTPATIHSGKATITAADDRNYHHNQHHWMTFRPVT